MSRPVRHTLGWWIGMCLSAILATAGAVALRHALKTPQPQQSLLPGEASLYRWQRRCIFYKVYGPTQAPPLVLLHPPAVGACAHEMRHLMGPLARTYRVYAPDLPGFGLSDRPDWQYSAALYSSLCQDFLRDVVKEPATLVASELSCNYAVSAAASAPDLCRALILISPHALEGNAHPALPRTVTAVPFLKTLLYPLLCTRVAFLLMHDRKQREYIDFAQFYAQTHQLGAEHAAMALLAGKLVENVSTQFQGLQQPVLLIWGALANAIPQGIPAATRARLREVKLIEAGPAAHKEQPESVVAAIRCWQTETMSAFEAAAAPAQAGKADQAHPGISQIRPGAEEEVSASRARSLPLAEEDGPPVSSTAQTGSALAYCVKCKQKREIQGAYAVTMKNGRAAVRGTCAVCGTRLNRIGKLT